MTATLTAGPARTRSHRIDSPSSRRLRPPRPVNARTYRRRRALVGAVLATISAAAVLVLPDVLAGGGASAGAATGQHGTPVLVTAQPGDTLWSIATEHHGAAPLTRYVDALVDLNGGPAIQAGQSVLLP